MLYHTINQTDYKSSEKEDTVSKKLENLIENLKTNFSPDSIKEVRILFKEVAKAMFLFTKVLGPTEFFVCITVK